MGNRWRVRAFAALNGDNKMVLHTTTVLLATLFVLIVTATLWVAVSRLVDAAERWYRGW